MRFWSTIASEPTALIGWMPRTLAHLSLHISPFHARLVGTLALVIQTIAFVACVLGWLAEPFPNLVAYFREAVFAIPVAFILCTLLWGTVIGCIALVAGVRASSPALFRATIVAPLSTAVPGLLLSIFMSLSLLSHPNNNFTTPATKPAWLTSGVFDVLGHPLWFILGVILMVANWKSCCREIAMQTKNHCQHCGYDLTGNTSGVCPECGTPTAAASS